ncbi:MAG TPA: Eco57I restriction-modification methylase domain-containing protein, partial [Steroidobacteraceae bacterium]
MQIHRIETDRCALQARLDSAKTQSERNRLGQFATPPDLARDIAAYAITLFPETARIRFLDPAIGTGAFYSALRQVLPSRRLAEALGFEIDPHYGEPARRLWNGAGIDYRLSDFTRAEPEARFNLVICNPPYVRHHHLSNDEKIRLQRQTQATSGVSLSGLAGLYCHFLALSHAWMAEGGVAGWLIPSEFMDVNYGQALKRYLLENVTLLHIHRFDPSDVQFSDALVSSAVVWFRKAPPPPNHLVKFTLGGTLEAPKVSRHIPASALAGEPKWTRFPAASIRTSPADPVIGDFFQIKRGLATGDNSFFILSPEQIRERNLPFEVFRPILPSPRYLNVDRIESDRRGHPRLDRRLFLLDTDLNEDEIRRRYPSLFKYLQEGKRRGLHERYLCRHRTPWYAQEKRPPAPIVCTYLGRKDTRRQRPFRFILNRSEATAANVWLMMYPTPQ